MNEVDCIRDFLARSTGPSTESREAARARLQALISGRPDIRRRVTRRPRWKLLVPALPLAAVLALVAGLIANPLLEGGRPATAAAAALLTASHIASLQPVHALQPGEYAYTRSEGAYFDEISRTRGTWGALVRTKREIWIGSNGSGRIRQQSEPPVFLAPGDRARWKEAGAPPLAWLSSGETYDKKFGPGGLGPPLELDGFKPNELLRLANNPDALRAAIQAAAEKTDNPLSYEMLTIVGDLLGETAAPPQLRASLYQVAADIPGVELLGTVADRAGRQGIAVAASRDSTRCELIFDPKTSTLFAKEETLTRQIPDTTAPVGTAISYTLYLDSKIVPAR